MPVNNKLLEQIFKPVNKNNQKNPVKNDFPFKKGNLIIFNYLFWKHDPYPLVIISPPPKQTLIVQGKGHLWGINLHLLQFRDIKKLLNDAKSPGFSYLGYVKNNTQLREAYRCYKWGGIKQVKTLDIDFFLNMANVTRSKDPAEEEIIRKNVQQQIQQQINPKTYEVNVKTLNKTEAPPGVVSDNTQSMPNLQNKVE
jgi:hypothetical protein